MSTPHPFFASGDGAARPVAMAHRGFSQEGLENSMAAFRAAVELGFRHLETDVHTTADGVLLHGQNWDWRAECAETGVVLRIRREDGPDILTFTEAGGLARSGLDSAGIGLTANALECDRDYQRGAGVPLPFMSQGGTSLIAVLLATGVVLSFARDLPPRVPRRAKKPVDKLAA